MKKFICALLVVALSTGALTACGKKDTPEPSIDGGSQNDTSLSSSETSEPNDAETPPVEDDTVDNTTEVFEHSEPVKLEELPKMTEEHQLLHDTYLASPYYSILGTPFEKDDFSNFNHVALVMCFSQFYDGEQLNIDPDVGYPADIFETTLQKHLNISVDDIQKYAIYKAETNTYAGFEGGGGAPQAYIITSSQQDGNLLTINYTHYWGEPFTASDDSVVVIELGENDGDYTFISNTIVATYPQ